jgi:hypothetical protein
MLSQSESHSFAEHVFRGDRKWQGVERPSIAALAISLAVPHSAGSLGPPAFLPTNLNPEAIQLTDVDGDADDDLVVVHARLLRVWTNNGANGFSFFDQPDLWPHLAHDAFEARTVMWSARMRRPHALPRSP